MTGSAGVPEWFDDDPVQAKVYDAFTNEMKGSWVWLSRSVGEIREHSLGQYSALLTEERIQEGVSGPSWEARRGDGAPGFVQHHHGGRWIATYEQFSSYGIELLVYDRTWHSVRPDEVELAEEFRLLFNLWEDRRTRTCYYFDDSGNPIKAVVISDEGVRALASLVRRYQAAKQLHLALYLDSTRRADDLPEEELSWDQTQPETILSYYRGTAGLGERPFSRLFGKRIFPPPPVEASGIWPFEQEPEYEDFVIGTAETGEEILFTSDPEQLANYFGANPDNPHYLTPVYFRREVLNKYYADPDRFTVEDGYLRCAGLWGLNIDNDRDGHIMVFLGDLGRDIPRAEAQYWRSFNIPPPEEGPSDTLIRRAFANQFADPQSVDLRFPRAYRETNEAWLHAFNEPLFQPLHSDDRHILSKLHVPITDSASEFDEQVLYLAKLLVDSLNERMLTAKVGKGPADEKGLAKLERFLTELGLPDARALLSPFANVQGLRSRGAAHRKGSTFDITVAIGELGRQKGFAQLLSAALATLEALRAFAEQHRNSQ